LRKAELKPLSKDVDSSKAPSDHEISDESCFLNQHLRSRKVDKTDNMEDEDPESQGEAQAQVTI